MPRWIRAVSGHSEVTELAAAMAVAVVDGVCVELRRHSRRKHEVEELGVRWNHLRLLGRAGPQKLRSWGFEGNYLGRVHPAEIWPWLVLRVPGSPTVAQGPVRTMTTI